MPIAQLTYGNIAADHAVLTSDFQSAELDAGDTFEFTSAAKQYLIVTAIGTSDIYVAFGSGDTVADASVSPRARIKAGTFMPFSIASGVSVQVVAA